VEGALKSTVGLEEGASRSEKGDNNQLIYCFDGTIYVKYLCPFDQARHFDYMNGKGIVSVTLKGYVKRIVILHLMAFDSSCEGSFRHPRYCFDFDCCFY
jgi:hypothetical protein